MAMRREIRGAKIPYQDVINPGEVELRDGTQIYYVDTGSSCI